MIKSSIIDPCVWFVEGAIMGALDRVREDLRELELMKYMPDEEFEKVFRVAMERAIAKLPE